MRRHRVDGSAAALSRYADHILGPRDAPPMIDPAFDPELTATIRRLAAINQRPAPADVRERVWRQVAPHTTASSGSSTRDVKGMPMPALTYPLPGRGARRMPVPSGRFGLPLFALVLILLALTAYTGFSRWGGNGPEDSIPAAQVSTPADAAVTPQPGAVSNAIPPVPGCTTEPRAPGTAEQLIDQDPTIHGLLPRDSGDVNHRTALLDGDAYVALYTNGPADQATIDAINATLAQFDTCRYYAYTSEGKADLNGRYLANFSDNYLTLQFGGVNDNPELIERSVGWLPRWQVVPRVEQAWVTNDGRVMTTILTGLPMLNGTARTVMVFSQSGDRWLIDEISSAMVFDELPEDVATPVRDDEHDLVPIVIYDADAPRDPGVDGNYSFMGLYAPDYPFIADGGLIIRLVNLGSLPHTFMIPELDIVQTLDPGDVVDVPIDAPVGTYEWEIYEGLDPDPTASNSIELVPPGTQRGLG